MASLHERVKIFEFPKITDPRGNLSFIEGGRHVPFSIKRVFYIYDVPGGESRGGHAHKECGEVLVALSGALDVIVTNGREEMTVTLNRANKGLLIPPGTWRILNNFTTGTICLALATHQYEEEDYIRDYDDYINYVKENNL